LPRSLRERVQAGTKGSSKPRREKVVMLKPVAPRELALQDIDEALAYYLGEQAEAAALGLPIDAIQKALTTSVAIGRRAHRAMPMNSMCPGCAAGR
jgi:hypothetical protein